MELKFDSTLQGALKKVLEINESLAKLAQETRIVSGRRLSGWDLEFGQAMETGDNEYLDTLRERSSKEVKMRDLLREVEVLSESIRRFSASQIIEREDFWTWLEEER
ncbi:MAG: hypothetical protein WCT18_02795 [Patescibacteria group bacterium]